MQSPLKIIKWPDPRLKKVSKPVEVFGPDLRAITDRMFELMYEARGVGLAAPQVGLNIRLFVINPTGEPDDAKVYANPELTHPEGEEEGEEGCLSLPEIRINVARFRDLTIQAQDVDGHPFEQAASGFITRIWQHEFDHLNGILLTDRMGPVAKMASRKILKDLEAQFQTEKR